MLAVLLSCLAVLLALGLLERAVALRARAAVPIRIHVNGTRGKSTVTRLVASALREAGIPTLAKVTGTAPRLIRPDGREAAVVRRAPASIREQAWLLREARRAGARALVAECMAVRPDLQWASEHEMVRATIGVITNARLDHREAMGQTTEEIAMSLASSIPRGAVLVTGETRHARVLADRCARLGTRLVVVDAVARGEGRVASGNEDMWDPALAGLHRVWDPASAVCWQREDAAIALAVTRELGIADDVALKGMAKAAPDPGTMAEGVATIDGRDVAWLDATAANDPESLDLLVSARLKPCPTVAVYNHRGDRPDRLRAFAEHSEAFRAAGVVLITGNRPSLTLLARVRRSCPAATFRFVPSRRIAAGIRGAAADARPGRIVFCGNTRGWVRPVDQRPTTCDQRPTTCNQRPTTPTNNQRPTTSDQRPC